MRHVRKRTVWIIAGMSLVALGGLLSLGASAEAFHGRSPFRYEIQLTNITRGQIFSPAVVYTHTKHMSPLFTLGQPASEELAAVAEDAMTDPLVAKIEASPHAHSAVLLTGENGPILPGETARVVVEATSSASLVSLVGMLVTTNDAFYALKGQRGPLLGSRAFTLRAYDAGSEANNELCSHVPGPPCGSGGVRDTEGAEGYVHVHAGIHGVGDLEPAVHDWKNPVAQVIIRRLSS